MKRYKPLFVEESDHPRKKDGDVWQSVIDKDTYAGKYKGKTRYFDSKEKAKAYASKGTATSDKK